MNGRLIRASIVCLSVAASCSSSHQATGALSGGGGSSQQSPACSSKGVPGNGHFKIGKQITIGDHGFDPLILVTGMGLTVTWTNRSSTTQSVVFDNWDTPLDSGPIGPGQSWTFKAVHTGSVIYHSSSAPCRLAQLQIQLQGNGTEPGG